MNSTALIPKDGKSGIMELVEKSVLVKDAMSKSRVPSDNCSLVEEEDDESFLTIGLYWCDEENVEIVSRAL